MNELEKYTKAVEDCGLKYAQRFCLRRSQDRYVESTGRFLKEAEIRHARVAAPLPIDEVWYFFDSAADLKRFLEHATSVGRPY